MLQSLYKKYFVSADVTFFESVPYFLHRFWYCICVCSSFTVCGFVASLGFSLVPPEDISETNASTPVRAPVKDFRIIYDHRQKVLTSESVPVNPSTLDGPLIQPSTPPSDLDILIALQKGKRSFTDYPISNFIFYDHLSPQFRQLALSLSSESIPKPCEETLLLHVGRAMNEKMNALVS